MFDPQLQKMKGTLLLNAENKLAFFYSAPLDFVPQWASIDVERGEIYIGANENDDSEGIGVKLGEIETKIYDSVMREDQILLVHMEFGDFRRPGQAIWVPLTVAHQRSTD